MKPLLKTLSISLFVAALIISCQKDKVLNPPPLPEFPRPTAALPMPSSGPVIQNWEYFRKMPWKGNELHITSTRLTKEAIDKGIRVYVAPFNDDWDENYVLYEVPSTVRGIQLSYSVQPNHLYIVAQPAFYMIHTSDVEIEYK